MIESTTHLMTLGLRAALFLLAMAMLACVWRMIRGPRAQDRMLALDALTVAATLSMLVLGVLFASAVYVEAALLLALFGFVGSAALGKFLLRGEVIE